MVWNPKSGSDPYGRPAGKPGNADELWRRATSVPCPKCGATAKSLRVDGDSAKIVCRSC